MEMLVIFNPRIGYHQYPPEVIPTIRGVCGALGCSSAFEF